MDNNDPFFNPNTYVAFDATSIKDIIISRLNQGQIFTDQNYQGSNLSAFLDVISYTFSTLLYYLNKTSSESMFSEAQIYENMNRIVKLLNYDPVGKLGQKVGYNLLATSDLVEGNYVIPRYTSIKVSDSYFSFTQDVYFSVTTTGVYLLQNNYSDLFLNQGICAEYPIYTATGSNNEIVYLNVGSDTFIDHNHIDVYIYSNTTNKWQQWQRTENLFLNKSQDKVFQARYNPNKNYELKFGDDVNGKSLSEGDKVLIFYLSIDPNVNQLAANTLNQQSLVYYNSLNYRSIITDLLSNQSSTIPTSIQLQYISLSNNFPSTPYVEEENVDSIRKNASNSFISQNRLVTTSDFENYIKTNYPEFFADVSIVNNEKYLSGHLRYLYDIGLKSPQLDDRVLFNQIKFATSCNFNNIYVYTVPANGTQIYTAASQKELLINDLESMKILTSEIVTIDPVYMNFDFYVRNPRTIPSTLDLNYNSLLIYKDPNSRRSASGIQSDVANVIVSYFSKASAMLGQTIDVGHLNSQILSINGVQSIRTYRSDINQYVEGLSFLVWNQSHPVLDISVSNQNINLNYFQYPVLNSVDYITSKIYVIDPTGVIKTTDF